ncbi:unnamed protein product [Protopolystoma xenopodis]|uniref:Uncharacterized protein n=1 Tax=Protopolystoma xenopodis TaxID=117903 RepID=A0A448WLF5_9PLAT|nr:unnamed protein product [Protopolystoma xenopodis]
MLLFSNKLAVWYPVPSLYYLVLQTYRARQTMASRVTCPDGVERQDGTTSSAMQGLGGGLHSPSNSFTSTESCSSALAGQTLYLRSVNRQCQQNASDSPF